MVGLSFAFEVLPDVFAEFIHFKTLRVLGDVVGVVKGVRAATCGAKVFRS